MGRARLWCVAALLLAGCSGAMAGSYTTWGQPAPHAASGPAITVTQFTNPLSGSTSVFGRWVSLSADGDTAMLLGYRNTTDGAAAVGYVYRQTNGVWSTSPAYVFETSQAGYPLYPMALSADGSLAAFATGSASSLAVIAVYAKANGLWSSAPVAILPGAAFLAEFSTDGAALLVADSATTVNGVASEGEVRLYKKVNGAWNSSPVAVFHDPDPVIESGNGITLALSNFGLDIALSQDGNTILIGDPVDANSPGVPSRPGRAYLYHANPDGSWPDNPQPDVILAAPNATVGDYFGASVALTQDGHEAFVQNFPSIGMAGEETIAPAVYLYRKSNGQWSGTPVQSFTLLPPYTDENGYGLSLSGNDQVFMVSAWYPLHALPYCCGVVLVYTRSQDGWSRLPVNVLAQPDSFSLSGRYNNYFGIQALVSFFSGSNVALSYNGSIALIGNEQIGGLTPPPPNEVPTYGGSGVAFAFETSDNWQTRYTGAGTPPPPPPPPDNGNSGGGGALGGGLLAAFLLLALARRFAFQRLKL